MRQRLFAICSLTLAATFVGHLHAAQFLVVTRSSSGAWSIEGVESVQINGKDKARHSDIAAARQPAWNMKSVAHLPEAPLQTWPVICRAPDGALWAKSGAAGWVLLIPDGLKRKTPGSAEALWKESTVTIRKDRADKTTTAVRVEDLYAILPGTDVGASATRLATDAALHQAPGVNDAQAFRRTVELTAPVVKAFPAAEKVREHVRSELALRLRNWSRGDALIGVLDEAQLLAGASQAAFSEDAAQKKLREEAYAARRQLDRRIAILRALDVGRQSEAFLVAYHEFEPFDRSFPDLAQARRKHLEASALAHVDESQRFRKAGDYVGAIRHLRLAHLRNPGLSDAAKLLEEVRLEVARLSSQQFAAARSGLDPRSPTQVQAQRRLRLAEQYINDSKAAEAEKALEEAESIDRDEPRIKLLQASLSVLRGDLGLALALLDVYAGMAITPQDFEQGEKLRASVHYKIENLRTQTRGQLKTAFDNQRFGTALQNAAEGLKVDNEEASFLYQAGVNACVLRHCPEAAPLLRQFLTLADSTTSSREQRVSAIRLLQRASQELRPASAQSTRAADLSWFSGAPLEPGIFYDPISLAFQPKVARISASHHLNVNYEWSGNQLRSIHTKYEEKKTAGNVARVALGVGLAAGPGVGNTIGWKTPDRETNDFYFNYYDDLPQVFNVNRENQVVKSRTISVSIPGIGIGGFGAFGGLASLGSMGGLGGLAGMKGLSGRGNWAGLFATASSVSNRGSLANMAGAGMDAGIANDFTPRNYSIHGDPAGGSTSGYLTLWNNPRLDTELTYLASGKRVAVGFSGNHFFHPFAFDGIHLFDLDYDEQGRIAHAWELEQPNPPRLDFTWEGKRLLSVVARENTPAGNTVYSRVLNYAGEKLLGEAITVNGKTSRIQYKYDKQGNLTEAECDDDATLDGRSRKVEFLVQTEKGGDSDMHSQKALATLLLAGWMAAAQSAGTGTAPQAGWTPAPRQGGPNGMSESQIARSVENYRQMWRKMKPDQQKRTLQMGGFTPEQYERMLRGGPPAGAPAAGPAAADKSTGPDYNRGADAGTLDSLGQSLIDLNAIRDTNVGRLQKDGCPPEVATRIAELRGKLARLEGEPNGHDVPAQPNFPARRTSGADPLDAAANWFKADDRADATGAAGPSPGALLDSVLPGGEAARPKPLAGDAASRRKTQEDSAAQIRAELAQLQGACVPVKP